MRNCAFGTSHTEGNAYLFSRERPVKRPLDLRVKFSGVIPTSCRTQIHESTFSNFTHQTSWTIAGGRSETPPPSPSHRSWRRLVSAVHAHLQDPRGSCLSQCVTPLLSNLSPSQGVLLCDHPPERHHAWGLRLASLLSSTSRRLRWRCIPPLPSGDVGKYQQPHVLTGAHTMKLKILEKRLSRDLPGSSSAARRSATEGAE